MIDIVNLSVAPRERELSANNSGVSSPACSTLARADWVASQRATAQKVLDALVATMHWIATHSAADKLAGNVTPPVSLATTYTNSFAEAANELEGTK